MTVHITAQNGFAHGNLYDRARPSYQSAALSYIRRNLRGNSPFNVAEIGSGTGIFTRALLAHPEWASDIARLNAVEPSQGMRELFSRTVEDARATVSEGTFEGTGLQDGWADIVIIAQAFHWCQDYDSACREFARILKPEGAMVFIWNLEDRKKAGWVAQVRNCIEIYEAGSPQFRLGLWRKAFDTQAYQIFFQPPLEKVWEFNLPATKDIVVDRAFSKSYIAVLAEHEKKSVHENTLEIIEKGEGKVWIDQNEGIFEYPYECFVVIAQKM